MCIHYNETPWSIYFVCSDHVGSFPVCNTLNNLKNAVLYSILFYIHCQIHPHSQRVKAHAAKQRHSDTLVSR